MSLGERDEIIQKLNAAFNVVCDEVDTVKRKLKEVQKVMKYGL